VKFCELKATGKSLQIFVVRILETNTSMYLLPAVWFSRQTWKLGAYFLLLLLNLACLQYHNSERQFIVKSCFPKWYLNKTLKGTQQKVKFMIQFTGK